VEEIMDFDNKKATRQSYGEALLELGRKNEKVVVLDADLAGATKTNIFAKEIPERFFDMGIAEQDMISTAAGFATCGKIPFASTFAVFATGRVYDQIRNSICYPNLNVKICATHCGITVGEDGATHQMLEDINLMRGLPNMTVISPADDIEAKWAVNEASKINGPVYIRFGRSATPIIYEENYNFEFGNAIQFGDGTDATIFATGIMVAESLKAKEVLGKEGIHIRVVDIHTIKPIDKDIIIKCAKETKKLISVEEHSIIGGLGTAISEVLVENCPAKLTRMGIKDCFGKSGKASELLEYFGLTSKEIINEVKK
jgi:transketolase